VKAAEEELSAAEMCISTAENLENCNWGAEKKMVICQSCAAESIYDALQISAVCPFCDSNKVMEAACENTMAPGGVVLFKITAGQAKDLFRNWIKRKWFAPKEAKESAEAKEFMGLYLPYWTFDTDTDSQFTAEYGKDRRVKKGDKVTTVTDWYKTRGTYQEAIDDELVVATTNHHQSMLRGLEPFNTADNKAYQPEYVKGFVAERYAVGIKDAWNFAKQTIRQKLSRNVEQKIIRDNHADRVRHLNLITEYKNITYKYLLLPIWISHFKYQEKVYHFMVNGQTGKISGHAPISWVKVLLAVVGALMALGLFALMGGFG
jgi:hypothetical protein